MDTWPRLGQSVSQVLDLHNEARGHWLGPGSGGHLGSELRLWGQGQKESLVERRGAE